MSPIAALQAAGHPAAWLADAEPLTLDRLGTHRYELDMLTPDAVLDLARLTVDGWRAYVTRGHHSGIRVTLKPPTDPTGGKGLDASARDRSVTFAGRSISLPGEGGPSRGRARAREGGC